MFLTLLYAGQGDLPIAGTARDPRSLGGDQGACAGIWVQLRSGNVGYGMVEDVWYGAGNIYCNQCTSYKPYMGPLTGPASFLGYILDSAAETCSTCEHMCNPAWMQQSTYAYVRIYRRGHSLQGGWRRKLYS